MLSRGRWTLTTITGILMAAFAWFILAPLQLGGRVSYIILSGNSMEPGFHLGDLVLARAASEYQIGDIVAYRHPDIGVVFHRIIARNGEFFTLKGDHNTWEDSFSPEKQDILGKYWFFLPKAGNWISSLRAPFPMVLLSLGIGIAFVWIITESDRSTNLRRKRLIRQGKRGWVRLASRDTGEKKSSNGGWARLASHDKDIRFRSKMEQTLEKKSGIYSRPDWLLIPGSIFVGALVLGFFAFTRPRTIYVPDDTKYQHLGFFGYSASVPTGVYDSQIVQPGEPVFSQISCEVNFNFIYILAAPSDQQLAGRYQMNAVLSDTNGWKRTFPLMAETEFSGSSFWTSGGLDLCQVQGLISHVQEQTGVEHHVYALDVSPDISIQGALAGKFFKDDFSPHLRFQLDPLQMQLSREDGDSNPLEPIKEGTLAGSRPAANRLQIFGFEIEVLAARWISILSFGLAIGAGLVIGLPIWREWRQDEASRIRILYGTNLVEVNVDLQKNDRSAVEVSSIDDLVKIAEKYGAMILHKAAGFTHTYMVQDGEIVYRYTNKARDRSVEMWSSSPSLKNDLLVALRSGAFRLHYQPVVSLGSGDIVSVEALARWDHPEYGNIPPSVFIPLAEESGLIEELDEWVLRTACAQVKTWQDAGLPPVDVSVNLSPSGLRRHDVSNVIAEVLDQTQISPQRLQLELTKSKILESEPAVLERLHDLHKMGVQLAMDEFSQLSSEGLNADDFSMIKINQEVLGSGYNDRGIGDLITAMIIMARKMKMQVFAKGIETEEQLGLIRAQRFDGAQGYLLSKPLPPEEVTGLLAEGIQVIKCEPNVNRMSVDEKVFQTL